MLEMKFEFLFSKYDNKMIKNMARYHKLHLSKFLAQSKNKSLICLFYNVQASKFLTLYKIVKIYCSGRCAAT